MTSSPRLIFEPHEMFQSGKVGEDWPIGYISEGGTIPLLLVALHEVIGDKSGDDLRAFAIALVTAVNECATLLATNAALVKALGNLLEGTERHVFGDECLAERESARALLASEKV